MCQECYNDPVIREFFEQVYDDCRRINSSSQALGSAIHQYIEKMMEKGEEFRAPLPSTRTLQEAIAFTHSASLFIICMVENDFDYEMATERYRIERGDLLINAPPGPEEVVAFLVNANLGSDEVH